MAALAVCAAIGAAALTATSNAAPAGATVASGPSLTATGGDLLQPRFRASVRTYAARCGDNGLTLRLSTPRAWSVSADGRIISAGKHHFGLEAGEGVRIGFRRDSGGARRSYFVRCLPEDFPDFTFQSIRPGGPKLFALQMANTYAGIFSADGAPLWWFKASGHPNNAQVLEDGTVAWDPVDQATYETGNYQIHTLTGRLLKTITSASGGEVDVHDLQYLPNGNHVIGTHVFRSGVDTTAYGGTADATIRNIEIQELTPSGKLVRSWDSGDHIALSETPQRWWDTLTTDSTTPYDVAHWNAVAIDGRYMYLSFRHLDAIYKVDRRSGRIIWKLGGTETAKSLRVLGDPLGDYPLGGQHDVRVLEDGTVTAFDNATQLGQPPRGVRYRINERKGTARLVSQLKDPKVKLSSCCGSFRAAGDGWLVDWGLNGAPNYIGAYDRDGDPVFRVIFPTGVSYRANPVPQGAVTVKRLRRAMDKMARR